MLAPPRRTGSLNPNRWPVDRFDLMWLLSRASTEDRYRFRQVNQGLLEGDVPT